MTDIRHDWTHGEALALYGLPFNDLIYRAHTVHRLHFDPNSVQKSRLLNIKTGGCPEDCAYCSQSARHATGVEPAKLMEREDVLAEAQAARAAGVTRYCLGAAWRNPKDRDLDALCGMIAGVKALGLETCATLGMLTAAQAGRLKDAGLDFYNHNIDTSRRHYVKIVTTRVFDDRLETLRQVRAAGIKVCCGGIIGMGEEAEDRVDMLVTLATLPEHPESVPVNMLVAIEGTPLESAPLLDPIEFVRTVATARVMMPRSFVRLSAGRDRMTDEMQALCFFAGANSIFFGDRLLTTGNAAPDRDRDLLRRLGIDTLETA